MAKKALSINRFDAGIVEGPNPRDIANEASVTLEGVDPTVIGALRPIGNMGSPTFPNMGSVRGFLPGARGFGLYQFATDFDGLHLHMSTKLVNGMLPFGFPTNIDWTLTSQPSTKSVLYTILTLNRYTHEDLITGTLNLPDNDPFVGEFNVYVNRYLFDDPNDADNGWYQIGREITLPPATTSGAGDPAYAPVAGIHTYDFNHNLSADEDLERWPLSNDATGGIIPPDKAYFPKFYTINGFPRMYDANKHSPSYYFGYAKRGVLSNTDTKLTHLTDQVNQWTVEPNFLLPPRVSLSEDDNTTAGFWQNGSLASPGTGTFDCNCWSIRMIDSYHLSTAYSPETVELIDGTGPQMTGATGNHGFDTHHHTYGQFRTDLYFIKDEEGGGFLADSGEISFYCSFIYDDKQESPLTEVTPTQHYPTQSAAWDDADGNAYWDNNMKLGISFCTSGHDDSFYGSQPTPIQGSNPNLYPSPRVCAVKMYYSYGSSTVVENEGVDDANIYLLFEMDYERGYRVSGTAHWNTLVEQGNLFTHVFRDPPQFEDYVTENNYIPGQDTQAQFATAVHAKQRTWIGNVRKRGIDYSDRVFKSPVGRPDIFPDENYIDIVGADGDEIVHLAHLDAKLLVFKKRNLYVVNIESLDEEKLEAKRNGLGVPHYQCVIETPHGIAWVNSGGVWLYDGTEFHNLTEEEGVDKISLTTWKDLTGWVSNNLTDGAPAIAYSQSNDKLIINVQGIPDKTFSGDLLAYHFRTKAWFIGRDAFPSSQGLGHPSSTAVKGNSTQMIQDYQNRITLAYQDDNDVDVAAGPNVIINQWAESTPTDINTIPAQGLLWKSKELDFGNLGAKKTINKIYITYTCGGSTAQWTGLYLFLLPDGFKWLADATCLNATHTPLIGYNSDTLGANNAFGVDQLYDGTITLSPTAASKGLAKTNSIPRTVELGWKDNKNLRDNLKKLNSLQLVLYNPSHAVPKEQFSIDDITIIFKEHSTK